MYCRICNVNLPWDAQFCSGCGTRVDDTIRQVELLDEIDEKTITSVFRKTGKEALAPLYPIDQISFWFYSAFFFFAATVALSTALIFSLQNSLENNHAHTPSNQNAQYAECFPSPVQVTNTPKPLRNKWHRVARRAPALKTKNGRQTNSNSTARIKNGNINSIHSTFVSEPKESALPH